MNGSPLVDIYIHTYKDDPNPVLEACKRHLPGLRTFLLVDGDTKRHERVNTLHFTDRLKPQPNGGAWLSRWFRTALDQGSDVALKLDPDSKVHRPFNGPLPDAPLFGAVMDSPAIGRFIHGGSAGFSQDFMRRALPLLDDECYKEPRYTMANGLSSSDVIIACVAERLGVKLTPWADVTYFPHPWWSTRYAISHGRWHKE